MRSLAKREKASRGGGRRVSMAQPMIKSGNDQCMSFPRNDRSVVKSVIFVTSYLSCSSIHVLSTA